MAEGERSVLRRGTVLVATESRALGGHIRRGLEGRGHLVEVCYRPAEALSRATERRPDLLVLDMEMSGADGVDILIELRQRETEVGAGELPVVALAGRGGSQGRATAKVLGAVACLPKPPDLEELGNAVRKALGRSPSRGGERPSGGEGGG